MSNASDETIITDLEKSNRKRNIVRYGILLFTGVFYAYFYGGFFPYTILYLLIFLPIISWLHLLLTGSLLKVSESLNQRVFIKGDSLTYKLLLKNLTPFFVPYVKIQMSIEGKIICSKLKSLRLSLGPFEHREFEYHIPLLYRGSYSIGVKSIQLQDILGLMNFAKPVYETKTLLVKPRIVEALYNNDSTLQNFEGEKDSTIQKKGNDELYNIREYVYGDSFRRIHWKLSSKMCKTMVKEYRNPINKGIHIILNLNNKSIMNEKRLIQEDCLIEELISLCNYLIGQGIPVKLCTFNNKPITINAFSLTDFDNIYQYLSDARFDEECKFDQVLEYFTKFALSERLLCIFTIHLDWNIADKVLNLSNRGVMLELYYINLDGTRQLNGGVLAALAENNIRAYRLEPKIIDSTSTIIENTSDKEKSGELYEA